MDAQAMVELSRKWISVPPQQSCEIVSPYYYKVIPAMGFVTIELDVNSCPGVRYRLKITIDSTKLWIMQTWKKAKTTRQIDVYLFIIF